MPDQVAQSTLDDYLASVAIPATYRNIYGERVPADPIHLSASPSAELQGRRAEALLKYFAERYPRLAMFSGSPRVQIQPDLELLLEGARGTYEPAMPGHSAIVKVNSQSDKAQSLNDLAEILSHEGTHAVRTRLGFIKKFRDFDLGTEAGIKEYLADPEEVIARKASKTAMDSMNRLMENSKPGELPAAVLKRHRALKMGLPVLLMALLAAYQAKKESRMTIYDPDPYPEV